MMPAASRRISYLLAGMLILPGLGLYLLPEWAAGRFTWPTTPFAAMTMGSWFLGGAFVVWRAARLGSWSAAYPGLLFAALFGALQLAVVLIHRDEIELAGVLPFLYLLSTAAAALAGILWLAAWLRERDRTPPAGDSPPSWTSAGDPPPLWMRSLAAGFVLFAAYFGVRLMLGISRGGNVWPGRLSLATARSFGAFYTALSLAVVPLVASRSLKPVLALMPAAAVGSVLITIPALVYFEQFDFRLQPGGRVYIGTYLVVLLVSSGILLANRPAKRVAAEPASQ